MCTCYSSSFYLNQATRPIHIIKRHTDRQIGSVSKINKKSNTRCTIKHSETHNNADGHTYRSNFTINFRNRIFNVPGWTDLVQEKHDAARASYLDWLAAGKPRSGHVHQVMCCTRADFKLALRRCKAVEEQLRADDRAAQLANRQNPKAVWQRLL